MPAHLDFEGFERKFACGRPFTVWTRIAGDLLTPVAAYLKLQAASSGPSFLLESIEGGSSRGRYSAIGIEPDLIWRCRNGTAETNRAWRRNLDAYVPDGTSPLQALRSLIAENAIDLDAGLPPMAAGLFGYLGYDMVREMERLAEPKPNPISLPDAILLRPTTMIVFDNVRDEISVVRVVRPTQEEPPRRAFDGATEALDEIVRRLDGPLPPDDTHRPEDPVGSTERSNLAPEAYRAMVERAKEHILAGDIFQVVLSQRFEAPFELPAIALYRALRRVNPAPFLCYLDFGDFQIVCSSPEILVRVRDGGVTVRPIAGTRPRGLDAADDARLAQELLADPKERSEHLMLLDLGRNDVGRVAEIGSVEVTESFAIERYSQVMHIVSNVEGRLRTDRDAVDALVAGFPAGTVSGAPKVRAMQIIDDLEPDGRGVYAGCIGYFSPEGSMDTCIVLRTAVVKDRRMYVQAGAGIVADSDPAAEQQECVNKAKALFRAADEALRSAALPRRGQ